MIVAFGFVVSSSLGATITAARVIECGLEDERCPTVVTGVAISPDGRSIAVACDDHVVRILDATTGQIRTRLEGHLDWVRSVAFSPDGQLLASAGNDRSVRLWNAADGAEVFHSPEMSSAVASVSFHPNGQQLAAVGFCSTLAIINTSSGQITQQLECSSTDVRTVAFSQDGMRMAVAGRDGNIRLWNVSTGALERDIPTGRQRIRALAFSPDGKRLAAAGEEIMIHVIDLSGGEQHVTLAARPAKVFAAVFLDGQTLVTAGSDDRICIWDLATRSVTKELVGHTGSVASLACDKTGTLLVSGSYDTTLRIWNLAEGGTQPSVARSRDASTPGEAAR